MSSTPEMKLLLIEETLLSEAASIVTQERTKTPSRSFWGLLGDTGDGKLRHIFLPDTWERQNLFLPLTSPIILLPLYHDLISQPENLELASEPTAWRPEVDDQSASSTDQAGRNPFWVVDGHLLAGFSRGQESK